MGIRRFVLFANLYFPGAGLVYFGCFLAGSFSGSGNFLGLGGVLGFLAG